MYIFELSLCEIVRHLGLEIIRWEPDRCWVVEKTPQVVTIIHLIYSRGASMIGRLVPQAVVSNIGVAPLSSYTRITRPTSHKLHFIGAPTPFRTYPSNRISFIPPPFTVIWRQGLKSKHTKILSLNREIERDHSISSGITKRLNSVVFHEILVTLRVIAEDLSECFLSDYCRILFVVSHSQLQYII